MLRYFRKLNRDILKKLFVKHLVWTNIVTTAVFLGAADIIQQEIEYQQDLIPERYDFHRTKNMATVGLVQGPILHYFYTKLDLLVPEDDAASVVKKIFLDQTIGSPTFITIFFVGIGILEDKSYEEIRDELKEKFLTVYIADCVVWAPAQFINFTYVNPKYRVLYLNVLTMIFNIFLSYIKYKDRVRKHKNDKK